MVVDDGAHAVFRYRVDGRYTILDTSQTVALRTNPDATVGGITHTRYLKTCQLSVESYHTFVAGTIPYRTVSMLGHGGNIAQEVGTETVDVLTSISHARFLSTNPQQSCIVHINALDAYVVGNQLFLVYVSWLNGFSLVCLWIHAQQSKLVGTNPDVTLISCHTVDVTVDTQTRYAKSLTYGIVPSTFLLVVHHQGALSVEPNVVVLISKGA